MADVIYKEFNHKLYRLVKDCENIHEMHGLYDDIFCRGLRVVSLTFAKEDQHPMSVWVLVEDAPFGICSECYRALDDRRKCHECLENEFLNSQCELDKND